MSFWAGFAGGLQAGATIRNGWDERDYLDSAGAMDPAAAPQPGGTPALGLTPGPGSTTASMPADMDAAARAIRTIESGSAEGNYNALGRVTRTGDRAYGAYQVMGANIPSWTERHFGQRLTPQEFLRSPEAQDAVFRGEFGGYMRRYGAEGASRAWFAGERGMNRMRSQDVNGTSVSGYNSRFGRLYQGFLTSGEGDTLSGGDGMDGGEPVRVRPGELAISPMFNDVPAGAGQRMVSGNAELEQLTATAGGLPGARAVTTSAERRPLRAGEVELLDPITMYGDATATGGVAAAPGGRAQAEVRVPASGLRAGMIASSTFPEGEMPPGEPPRPISSDTFPPVEAAATARGGPATTPGGSAAAAAPVPAAAPTAAPMPERRPDVPSSPAAPAEAPAPTARPAAASGAPASIPRMTYAEWQRAQREGRMGQADPVVFTDRAGPAYDGGGGAAPADAPAAPRSAPAERPATASGAPASAPLPARRPEGSPRDGLSERERLMLLRDPSTLGPGEEERLRAGLPAGSLQMPSFQMPSFGLFGAGRRSRPAPAARTPPAAAPARPPPPAPTEPAPVRVERSAPAAAAAHDVEHEDLSASVPAVPPAPVAGIPAAAAAPAMPYAAPRDDAERFGNIRSVAQAALDRGDRPERVAERLSRSGIPYAEWPEPLRAYIEQRQGGARPMGLVTGRRPAAGGSH